MNKPVGKAPAGNRPASVFIAYSRQDWDLCEELRTHLRSLELDGKIEVFYDGNVEVGEKWNSRLQSELRSANLVVFLLSAEFFASDYIMQEEVPEAMSRRDRGESFVIPVFARHCRPTEALRDLQGVGTPGQPIESMTPRNKGWARVVDEIERKADLIKVLNGAEDVGVTLHLLRRLDTRLSLSTQRARSVWLCSRTGMGWNRNHSRVIQGLSERPEGAVRLLFLNPDSVTFELDSQMQWTPGWGAKGAQDPAGRRQAARGLYNQLVRRGMDLRVTDTLLPAAFWIFDPGELDPVPTALLEIVRWRAGEEGNVYLEQHGGNSVDTYQAIFEGVWSRATPWGVAAASGPVTR